MIRIDSVEINRFRGIRQGTISGFSDVNLLIGRNNSGKSTVGEAITWAARVIGGTDPLGRDPMVIWDRARQGASGRELWYRQDQSQSMSVTLRIGRVTVHRGVNANGQLMDKCEPDIRNQQNNAVFHHV